jgi:hypothetical protein
MKSASSKGMMMTRLPINADRFSRRAFIRRLGVSGAVIPLIYAERALGAGPTGSPRRFFAMVYGNGARPNFYPPAGVTDLTTATLGASLTPLMPFRSKMIMPIGLDYKNLLDDGFQYDGHFTYCAALTGTREKKSESRKATDASIDQKISDEIGKTVNLKAPLLTLGIRSVGDGCSISWRSAGVQNPAQQNAAPLFTSLFSGGGGSVPMAPAQVDTLLKRRQSVLDFVGKELTAFGKRLGPDDRMKLDQHAVSVRELEKRLSSAPVTGGTGGANCGAPAKGGTDVPGNAKAMFDIIGVAFRCDLNRVATVTISDDGGGDGTSFPWVGASGDFHQTAHASKDAQMTAITAWFMTLMGGLAQQLDATPEPGGTALDNSILLSMSNMDEGANHYNGKIPITMLGSCGGYFKTGQAVRYTKMAHNKLLASICNGMGLKVPGVGAAQYAGLLPEIIKA